MIRPFSTATMISSDDSVIDIAVKAPKMCLLTETAIVDFYEEAKTTIRLEHDNIVKVRKSQKHSFHANNSSKKRINIPIRV